jgi:hypothetical protein
LRGLEHANSRRQGLGLTPASFIYGRPGERDTAKGDHTACCIEFATDRHRSDPDLGSAERSRTAFIARRRCRRYCKQQ